MTDRAPTGKVLTMERPILFNAEMIQAILDGRKTQTRRPIKLRSISSRRWRSVDTRWFYEGSNGRWHQWYDSRDGITYQLACPHGDHGDVLWVRETWATVNSLDCLKPSKIEMGNAGRYPTVWYKADKNSKGIYDQEYRNLYVGKWRPSIHMPRWASRIDLFVKRVWAERIQDIKYQDCIAEGIIITGDFDLPDYLDAESSGVIRRVYHDSQNRRCTIFGAKAQFANLWDSIYANKGLGWETNPWVWVCEFERIK